MISLLSLSLGKDVGTLPSAAGVVLPASADVLQWPLPVHAPLPGLQSCVGNSGKNKI